MARNRAIEDDKTTPENRPASPHLAWETPKHSPNETPMRKGQLGQNVRQREKAEREGR